MELATYIALSRLTAQSREMDVTATNLANADTPGFKAERMVFSDWLAREPQSATPPGGRVLAFTQDRATYRDQRQGTFTQTGNPLDLSIGGDGYFTVDTPRGPRLTRAGRFSLGADGTIEDMDGDALLDANGAHLQVAPGESGVEVAGDGTVSSSNGQIGRIGVVTAAAPNQLKAEGGTLLDAGATSTSAAAAPRIIEGATEASNVQPVVEMTRMMTQLREFQFTTQFLQAESDRQQQAIDKIAAPIS
jgi:flagellar basal-body rod protein FlgF